MVVGCIIDHVNREVGIPVKVQGRGFMGKLIRKETQISQMERTAMRVSRVSIVVNLLLSAGKLAAGILASSGAMISDAIHSASDVFSTIIVMIGIRVSGKAADREHPYGHERMECVAAILLAVVLALTGCKIGISGVEKIVSGNYESLAVPGVLALVAAVVSVAVKEWMYWYTRFYAKKIQSSALMADAWHHRSDSLSSIGAFVGIIGARMGFPVMDPLASVVICLFILKASYDIFKDAIDKMVDRACDPELEKELKDFVLLQNGVQGIDLLRTRTFGSRIYVDVDISADGGMTLQEAHGIAEHVHDEIEENFEQVKHIMVHVNPA
jgi:cation diffusion facilitator family transporter